MEQQDNRSYVLTDNFEMLKALYDFQAVYPKTISFDEGEHFLLYQTSAKQRNWWQVVSMKGAIGFVPSNYVMKIKVEPSFLLGFLDSSIESLKVSKEDEMNGIIARLELIERLEAKKTQIAISAKVLESDIEFDNEKHYTENGHSSPITTSEVTTPSHDSSVVLIRPASLSSTVSPMTELQPSTPEPQSAPIVVVKVEDAVTPTAIGYDNSFTSDPSEATNTISDDVTIISQIESVKTTIETVDVVPNEFPEPISEAIIIAPAPQFATFSPTEEAAPEAIAITSPTSPTNGIEIDAADVYQIIDSIRQTTNLSHTLSCTALRVVLAELEAIYSGKILHLIEPIAAHLSVPLAAPDDFIEHTHDSQRLKIIFSQLANCTNDSQQRTWVLHEDEELITKFLTELIDILKNADKKICEFELACDQYLSVVNLIQYYQMETRWQIRKLLLKSFKALCYVDKNAIDQLLTSVLPMEMVQDMLSNVTNVERLAELATMLTMIYSMGQKMPINHRAHIKGDFIRILISLIESPLQNDTQDVLSDIMVNLILSINLQFDDFTDSIVMDAYREEKSAKIFTEKILVLLNREEDPLEFFDHERTVPNSVLKIFVDLFSSPQTAELFYTNDNKVLIDILVRQLSDLSPGDSLRRSYLELCRRIVRNTNYAEHLHRKSDLMKIFTRIFCEESECSFKDQQLVRDIANEFPQIFKA